MEHLKGEKKKKKFLTWFSLERHPVVENDVDEEKLAETDNRYGVIMILKKKNGSS